MKISSGLLLLLLATLLLPASADACSCLSWPPEVAYSQSSHVFRGSPISVEIVDPGDGILEFHYSMEVTGCWKGEVSNPQPLVTLVDEAACGVELFVGEDYLIYANGFGSELWSNLCAIYHASSSTGQQHLTWLGESNCPVSVDGASWGRVKAKYR